MPRVDRRFEAELKFGDTLNIPWLHDMGDATAGASTADITLYDTVQNTTQLIVNYWYYKAVGVDDKNAAQSRPDYLANALQKLSYSVAAMMDTKVNALFGFTNTVGTEGSALTDDVLIAAKEYLDLANAPYSERSLILDPESVTDLMKIDKFVRDDYVNKGAVVSPGGLVGRSLYGAEVYQTTNLIVNNTSYHNAAMLHREAILFIGEYGPNVERFRWPEKMTDVVNVQALFGCVLARNNHGVLLKTRS